MGQTASCQYFGTDCRDYVQQERAGLRLNESYERLRKCDEWCPASWYPNYNLGPKHIYVRKCKIACQMKMGAQIGKSRACRASCRGVHGYPTHTGYQPYWCFENRCDPLVKCMVKCAYGEKLGTIKETRTSKEDWWKCDHKCYEEHFPLARFRGMREAMGGVHWGSVMHHGGEWARRRRGVDEGIASGEGSAAEAGEQNMTVTNLWPVEDPFDDYELVKPVENAVSIAMMDPSSPFSGCMRRMGQDAEQSREFCLHYCPLPQALFQASDTYTCEKLGTFDTTQVLVDLFKKELHVDMTNVTAAAVDASISDGEMCCTVTAEVKAVIDAQWIDTEGDASPYYGCLTRTLDDERFCVENCMGPQMLYMESNALTCEALGGKNKSELVEFIAQTPWGEALGLAPGDTVSDDEFVEHIYGPGSNCCAFVKKRTESHDTAPGDWGPARGGAIDLSPAGSPLLPVVPSPSPLTPHSLPSVVPSPSPLTPHSLPSLPRGAGMAGSVSVSLLASVACSAASVATIATA